MCDQQRLRSACTYVQTDQSLCLSLEYSMRVQLLTEHQLEFLSLKGSCTGSTESTFVKMPHCWKSHVTAHIFFQSVVSTKRTPLRKSARSMRRGLPDRNHSNKEVISIGEETKEVSGRLANTDNSDGAVTKRDKTLVEACLQENEMKSPERSNSDEDKRVSAPPF